MGKELEYKLLVPDEACLRQLLHDAEIAAMAEGPWREMPMKTTYFDSPDRRFGTRHWTLRRRLEDGRSVVCVKTPHAQAHTRGEWQVRAELALDKGVLFGRTERLHFTELELELYEGAPAQMTALAGTLCKRYGLCEQPRSKFARARELK